MARLKERCCSGQHKHACEIPVSADTAVMDVHDKSTSPSFAYMCADSCLVNLSPILHLVPFFGPPKAIAHFTLGSFFWSAKSSRQLRCEHTAAGTRFFPQQRAVKDWRCLPPAPERCPKSLCELLNATTQRTALVASAAEEYWHMI